MLCTACGSKNVHDIMEHDLATDIRW